MRIFNQALAILIIISGAFIITGCPGIASNSRTEYSIKLDGEIDISNGDITVNKRYAFEGETIKITVEPKSGFAVRDIIVRDELNHSVNFIDPNPANNVYEFKMPPAGVTVYAKFINLRAGLNSAISTLSVASSWETIAEANDLLIQLQKSLGTAANSDSVVKEAITKLAGEGTTIGTIIGKMRQEEDFWTLPAANLPSYPIDKLDTENRTHLYYVGLSSPPSLLLGRGWTEGIRQNNYTDAPVGTSNGGVTRVPLTYQVGVDTSKTVAYDLLLWPVAQYVLEGTGSVEIREYSNPVKNTIGYRDRNIPYDDDGPNSKQRIGEVSVRTETPPLTAPYIIAAPYIIVKISSSQKITVIDSSGAVVKRICVGNTTVGTTTLSECGATCDGSLDTACGSLNGVNKVGFFFPKSTRYTITLAP